MTTIKSFNYSQAVQSYITKDPSAIVFTANSAKAQQVPLMLCTKVPVRMFKEVIDKHSTIITSEPDQLIKNLIVNYKNGISNYLYEHVDDNCHLMADFDLKGSFNDRQMKMISKYIIAEMNEFMAKLKLKAYWTCASSSSKISLHMTCPDIWACHM